MSTPLQLRSGAASDPVAALQILNPPLLVIKDHRHTDPFLCSREGADLPTKPRGSGEAWGRGEWPSMHSPQTCATTWPACLDSWRWSLWEQCKEGPCHIPLGSEAQPF